MKRNFSLSTIFWTRTLTVPLFWGYLILLRWTSPTFHHAVGDVVLMLWCHGAPIPQLGKSLSLQPRSWQVYTYGCSVMHHGNPVRKMSPVKRKCGSSKLSFPCLSALSESHDGVSPSLFPRVTSQLLASSSLPPPKKAFEVLLRTRSPFLPAASRCL